MKTLFDIERFLKHSSVLGTLNVSFGGIYGNKFHVLLQTHNGDDSHFVGAGNSTTLVGALENASIELRAAELAAAVAARRGPPVTVPVLGTWNHRVYGPVPYCTTCKVIVKTGAVHTCPAVTP